MSALAVALSSEALAKSLAELVAFVGLIVLVWHRRAHTKIKSKSMR
ncbi:hypothetical protein [Vibrio sp. WXL210]